MARSLSLRASRSFRARRRTDGVRFVSFIVFIRNCISMIGFQPTVAKNWFRRRRSLNESTSWISSGFVACGRAVIGEVEACCCRLATTGSVGAVGSAFSRVMTWQQPPSSFLF
jgi:hypothetical protein